MRIAVVGAGGWGTALAALLAESGHQVRMWVRTPALCTQLRDTRENRPYLPGVRLPRELMYTTALAEAVVDAQVVVFAVPSHAMRTVATALRPYLSHGPVLVSTSKGIEEGTLCTMTAVLREVLGEQWQRSLAVLSGPSFAAEVARGLPTAVTVAAQEQVAVWLQRLFSSARFRVYTTTDQVGVEVGGAVKNVIAIAAGVSDGLGCGLSARAALITRGLAEMMRLALRMGAQPQTLSGLSGVGDLILTCTSDLSRNHMVGVRLGRGEHITGILREMHMVAEGVRTCRSVFSLAQRLQVDMPIVRHVYALLYEGKPPRQVVTELLTREVKPEFPVQEN